VRHPEGIKLRRKPGKRFWYARATLPSGRRWEASTGIPLEGDRGAAARRAAALYIDASQAGGRAGAVPASVSEQLELVDLIAQYLEHEEELYRGHDGRHHGRIKTDLMRYIAPRWRRAEEITTDAWLEARGALHKAAGGPLGARSIAHLANTLRHFLRWARERGVVQTVPEIESPKSKDQRSEQRGRAAMDAGQRDRFLRALTSMKEHRASRVYRALFYSLLRKGELEALTLRWVDWKEQVIRLPAEHAKSGEQEEIDLHPEVARAIRGELKARGKLQPDDPVFGRFDYHQANTPDLQGGIFGRACLRAKIVKLRSDGTVDFDGLTAHHVTRHSSATIAAGKRGTTLEELMAMARWRSPDMAARYLHPTVKAGRRASRRL
jgi:integrase